MPGACRIGDTYIGVSLPCSDVQAGGSGDVFANGIPIARHGDITGGHACYPPSTIIATATTVLVNNKPMCAIDDLNVGHVGPPPCVPFHVGKVVVGSTDVFVEGL